VKIGEEIVTQIWSCSDCSHERVYGHGRPTTNSNLAPRLRCECDGQLHVFTFVGNGTDNWKDFARSTENSLALVAG